MRASIGKCRLSGVSLGPRHQPSMYPRPDALIGLIEIPQRSRSAAHCCAIVWVGSIRSGADSATAHSGPPQGPASSRWQSEHADSQYCRRLLEGSKRMLEVRRRDVFPFIGGAFLALPRIAAAEPSGKIPRVGYLWHAGSAKEEHPYFEALLEGFAKL